MHRRLRSTITRSVLVAPVAAAVALAGCVTSEVSALPQDRMGASVLADTQVERLGLDDAGSGPVVWWHRDSDPLPGPGVTSMSPLDRSHRVGAVAVFPADVASLPDDGDGHAVVVRPAWTSRVDNTSDTPSRSAFTDEVTLDFLHPGSPGQAVDDDAAVLPVEATVDVAAGTCLDLVSLQVWQVGPPQVDHQPGDLQAEFLGTVLATTACD